MAVSRAKFVAGLVSLGRKPEPVEAGTSFMYDDIKLIQLVRARDCPSRGRRFDSSKTPKSRELKST